MGVSFFVKQNSGCLSFSKLFDFLWFSWVFSTALTFYFHQGHQEVIDLGQRLIVQDDLSLLFRMLQLPHINQAIKLPGYYQLEASLLPLTQRR